MNGATTLDWVMNIRPLNNRRMIHIGASHHFLFCIKNNQNSLMITNFTVLPPVQKPVDVVCNPISNNKLQINHVSTFKNIYL